ncbi:MAG: Holliday junction branch migration protein RuvA [Balneolaceae bacterium]
MIARLKGTIIQREESALILDVGGVGYRVFVSDSARRSLAGTSEEVILAIHHHITDSDQRLFGFLHRREQMLFESLITVKGIGPKLALTILSGMDADALVRAIQAGDVKTLATISGIGKKSAERLSLELKGSLDNVSGSDRDVGKRQAASGSVQLEALDALEALGFSRTEAEGWIDQARKDLPGGTVSELVRKALSLKP